MSQSPLFIIFDEDVSEHAGSLKEHLAKLNFEIKSCTLDAYNRMNQNPDAVFADGAKFIFLGAGYQKLPDAPEIQVWQHQQFGCRIGWAGNICVLFANSDLPLADYKPFRTYCERMSFDHPDVVIPPETLIDEGVERVKNLFNDKDESIHQAQYSTLIYEFVNEHLSSFIQPELDNEEKKRIKTVLDDEAKEQKKTASAKLTMKQKVLCHSIIHAAALASAGVAFVPIPGADIVPITATQISMIVALGKVLDNKITKSDAQILLKAAAAPLAGRAVSKGVLSFVPGAGWVANAAIAGTITQILGWTIANDFATNLNR